MPLYSCNYISFLHPLTYEITTNFKPKIIDWINETTETEIFGLKESINPLNETLTEMKILNDSLKECVTKIRSICYKTHDLINAEVINNLKNAQGISYFEDLKRDQIVFISQLHHCRPRFFTPRKEFFLRIW